MAALRILAVAVATGRAGYVFLQGGQLVRWDISVKAVSSPSEMVAWVQNLINEFKPAIVVTEDCDDSCKKGKRSRDLIQAVAAIASHNYLHDISIPRPRRFPSKYEEADHLATRYPELIGHLPSHKRRIQETEPRSMILFEALALADQVLQGPPEQLAAAMG